jgi:hypothetical protein
MYIAPQFNEGVRKFLAYLTLYLPITTIVTQPFNVIKWQLKFNPVAQGLNCADNVTLPTFTETNLLYIIKDIAEPDTINE